jgi:hypothetical protein
VCVYIYIYQDARTPLHVAVAKGHDKVVETLVQAKADLRAEDAVSVLKVSLHAHSGMR